MGASIRASHTGHRTHSCRVTQAAAHTPHTQCAHTGNWRLYRARTRIAQTCILTLVQMALTRWSARRPPAISHIASSFPKYTNNLECMLLAAALPWAGLGCAVLGVLCPRADASMAELSSADFAHSMPSSPRPRTPAIRVPQSLIARPLPPPPGDSSLRHAARVWARQPAATWRSPTRPRRTCGSSIGPRTRGVRCVHVWRLMKATADLSRGIAWKEAIFSNVARLVMKLSREMRSSKGPAHFSQ